MNNPQHATGESPAPPDEPSRRKIMVDAEHRPRLLIADDDPVVRAVLTAQLIDLFDVVGTADDSESAIDVARRERPDAALIDVRMPAGGGLGATRGIRDVSPKTAVVILSIDGSTQSRDVLIAAGAMAYLRKGVPAERIAERLHESIAAHPTQNSR
jgi:two-component system, NarL family, response regulator DesR